MDLLNSDPRTWLAEARASARDGKHSEALELFAHFFEHALDDDPASLYGVRLSYALKDWINLAQAYPPAMVLIQKKKTEALECFYQSGDRRKFHDYVSICKYLKCEPEAIHTFLECHTTDPKLANEVIHYLWDKLVALQHWDVCAAYLLNWDKKYQIALDVFDESIKLARADPTLGGDDFDKITDERYTREAVNIVLVLSHTGQADLVADVLERIDADMSERNRRELGRQIEQLAKQLLTEN